MNLIDWLSHVFGSTPPWLSSSLAASVVAVFLTFLLNRWAAKEDAKARNESEVRRSAEQQKQVEEWERRKYEAGQRLMFFHTFTELFYASRNEVYFYALELDEIDEELKAFEKEARQWLSANNPQIKQADLEQQFEQAVSPFRVNAYNKRGTRMKAYNECAKAQAARADASVSAAAHYLRPELHERIVGLLRKFEESVVGKEGANLRLQEFAKYEPEFRAIQRELLAEVDLMIPLKASAASHA